MLFLIEGMTNLRLRQETGRMDLVPPSRRCCGPGTTPIMAAFTHLNAEGSRVANGSYGVRAGVARTVSSSALEACVYLADTFVSARYTARALQDQHGVRPKGLIVTVIPTCLRASWRVSIR